MSKKAALGKGLGSLIPQTEDPEIGASTVVTNIAINLIHPNPNQPRKTFKEEALTELADSIKQQGIIQPIIVEKDGGRYNIIAGERRFRAARMAGLFEIPVIIRKYTDEEKLEAALIENIQREDLNAIEEAQGYHMLMRTLNLNQDEVAQKVGKKRSTVANSLRLLNLPEDIQASLAEGRITAGHARTLLSVVNPSDMRILYSRILNDSLSVRESERQAATLNNGVRNTAPPPEPAAKVANPEISRMEQQFIDALGTKVSVKGGLKKGKIEISYFSLDDLERIYDIITGSDKH
ncbi:MAG: chromosome partitioning protein ParB [Spirochaetes bacterium]|nr:MAG: chromosome partitioning protein ParB [Spirochaetota bacterium]